MSNSVTLHYTEEGQGIPLVLLHGYPFSGAIWQTQQQGLSSNYRVITPDMSGHGQSPAPDGVYEMELMARDVLALLDSLNVQKAAIMGHSMGGYVTFALWRLAPERFIALGLIDSQAGADSEEGRQGRYKTAEKVFENGSQVVAEAMVPRVFAPTLPEDEAIVEQARTMILNTRPVGIIGTLKGMAARPDTTELLPKINVPTLIITVAKYHIIPAQED